MKTIYIDTSCGISGDMLLNALVDLCDDPDQIKGQLLNISASIDDNTRAYHALMKEHSHAHHNHAHDEHSHNKHDEHSHSHGHGHRSYKRVLEIIESLDLDEKAMGIAKKIYEVIAEAESKVHGSDMENLHFHEVGRNRAISNVAGVALCISHIVTDKIICSEIKDGSGTVKCAHGILDVPVPAVKAMLENTDLSYSQSEKEGEKVTPSGLAMLIGIGAVTSEKPDSEPLRSSEAKGMRSEEGESLKAYLYDL